MAKLTDKNNCGTSCPLKKALRLFEGKYSAYILKELMGGKKRYSELRRNIPGISPKTLSEKLRYYTLNGIITRYSYPEIPPKVEYRLTPKGEALKGVINQLQEYGSEVDNLDNPASEEPALEENVQEDVKRTKAKESK